MLGFAKRVWSAIWQPPKIGAYATSQDGSRTRSKRLLTPFLR